MLASRAPRLYWVVVTAPAKKRGAKPLASQDAKDQARASFVKISNAEFVAGAARTEQVPTPESLGSAPEIAFAGRSNVGKSSLLNMMLQRKGLARTSGTPGCTRQINFFDVELAKSCDAVAKYGAPPRMVFVDLPGYGYAKVSKTEAQAWKALLEGYLHERPTLRGIVILVDVRRGLEEEERDLVEFMSERSNVKVVIAATKIDKLSLSARKPALAKLPRGAIGTSGETSDGRDPLWSRIFDACRVE